MRSLDPAASKLKVFVSYSRSDMIFADQLVAALKAYGITPFIDREGIHGAEKWQERLGQLILQADTVVFILTPDSATSYICKWEVDEALRLNKRIVPIVWRPLGEAQPHEHLRSLNYIFFYEEQAVAGSGFGTGLVRLIDTLTIDVTWIREHTRLGELASRWERDGRPADALPRGAELARLRAWREKRPTNAPELTALQRAFLQASEDNEAKSIILEQSRIAREWVVKRTILLRSVSTILVLSLLGATFGWFLSVGNLRQGVPLLIWIEGKCRGQNVLRLHSTDGDSIEKLNVAGRVVLELGHVCEDKPTLFINRPVSTAYGPLVQQRIGTFRESDRYMQTDFQSFGGGIYAASLAGFPFVSFTIDDLLVRRNAATFAASAAVISSATSAMRFEIPKSRKLFSFYPSFFDHTESMIVGEFKYEQRSYEEFVQNMKICSKGDVGYCEHMDAFRAGLAYQRPEFQMLIMAVLALIGGGVGFVLIATLTKARAKRITSM